jgi:hypothetical protein
MVVVRGVEVLGIGVAVVVVGSVLAVVVVVVVDGFALPQEANSRTIIISVKTRKGNNNLGVFTPVYSFLGYGVIPILKDWFNINKNITTVLTAKVARV